MEDGAVTGEAPDDRSLEIDVDLVEQMGSEAYVHFTIDAPPVLTEDTKELAEDLAASGAPGRAEAESDVMVARVSPAPRPARAAGPAGGGYFTPPLLHPETSVSRNGDSPTERRTPGPEGSEQRSQEESDERRSES